MKYIIQNVPERDISILLDQLNNVSVYVDTNKKPLESFIRTLRLAGDDNALYMEDDIILSKDFINDTNNFISLNSDNVINFWTLKKSIKKTTLMPPSSFMSNLCVYFPNNHIIGLINFYNKGWNRIEEHPTGMDLLVRDYLISTKTKYWLYQPSLVQHKKLVSAINPKRSKYRQSITFKDENI
jgi:hypothetical protein